MFTKEKKEPRTRPNHPLPTLVWHRWMELPLRLAGGFALSRSLIFGDCAPFALGFVAASGSTLGGICALVGAVAGYLTGMGLLGSLRYVAAAILIFAVGFAFYDVPLVRTRWFLCAVSAAITAVTGFLYRSANPWQDQQVLYFVSEVLLTGLSCRFYQGLTSQRTGERRAGLFFLSATLLCAVAGVTVPYLGSLAAISGTALVFLLSRGGSGVGALCGAGVGLALAASGGSVGASAGALAFAGMLSGSDDLPKGRLWSVLFGLLGGLATLLWLGGTMADGVSMVAGALLCLALPEEVVTLADRFSCGKEDTVAALNLQPPGSPDRIRENARYRLEEQSAAFATLHQRLRESMAQHPTGEHPDVIWQRTARRVCNQCPHYDACWQRQQGATYQELNTALAAMQERGSGLPRDYPEGFRKRCLYFDQFVTVANEEQFAFWTRRQYRLRLRESRAAVCQQYAQLSRLLGEAAALLGEELRYECSGSAAAERAMTRLGARGSAGLWLDRQGRRVLVVVGQQTENLQTTAGLQELHTVLGVPMELWESLPVRQGSRLTFRQAPPLSATVGVAVRKKEGQAVSGDSGSWFKDEQGGLWVTICDGMGSGPAASAESALVLHLLEDFLHAGVQPEAALTTLTSALALRGEVDGGFATVDLLHIDLYTGAGALYKLGAAPSYLRRQGSVSRVSGTALPPGLAPAGEDAPDVTRFHLGAGDCALLLSDGITDGVGDLWLRTLLERWQGDSPRRLAEDILKSPKTRTTDDCTVAVVQLRSSQT